MTMKKEPATIPAGQFKARCLALLDQVQQTGESIIVTKRGRPVVTVNPLKPKRYKPLRGSGMILGDIMAPPWGKWEMDR